LRLGLAYNQKPDADVAARGEPPSTDDRYAEWDDAATIDAVAAALEALGPVTRLPADRSFPQRLAAADLDLVFNMAEGLNGPSREAHVPAICEFLDVRYTGSDPAALLLGLHKGLAKERFVSRSIPTAPFRVVERPSAAEAIDLAFPVFVKPIHEGSSKGIGVSNFCRDQSALTERARELLERYQQPVLVEEFLPGEEYTVAILGTGANAQCLPVVGLQFDALPTDAVPVYGYEAKWVWDQPEQPLDIFTCPAPLASDALAEIEQTALAAYRALGCRDWGRVDIRCDAHGVPNVVEVNPLPGIIPDPAANSCFPKAARAAGMDYDTLIQTAVRLAWLRLTGEELPAARVAMV